MMKFEELNGTLENIKIELEQNILTVTMNRPKALNALNNQTLDELQKITDMINEDNNIYGVIITGEGRGFVAGADIVQMRPYKSEQGRDYAGYAQDTFNKIEAITKPVIAAVNGFALGGGCELALSCDIRIASEKAVFGQPEVTLGIMPCFGGTQRLPRLIGAGLAKEMMKDILKVSPIGVKYAKLSINKGGDMDLMNALELEKDLVGLCFATEDKEIGMEAFLSKQKPAFR